MSASDNTPEAEEDAEGDEGASEAAGEGSEGDEGAGEPWWLTCISDSFVSCC